MADIFDWSGTPASNTSVNGVNINTGMSPANVDNALREIMAGCRNTVTASLETFLAGTAGLPVANGGTGATTLTGILKGNGTGAVTAVATGGTTYKFLNDNGAMSAPEEAWVIEIVAPTGTLSAGTNKKVFRAPYAFTVTGVKCSVVTAQTSGSILTVDINEAGVSILSTKLTIDNTEKTSTTAAAAAVISDSAIADDAEISIDIDAVGTGGAGLVVTILGRRAG